MDLVSVRFGTCAILLILSRTRMLFRCWSMSISCCCGRLQQYVPLCMMPLEISRSHIDLRDIISSKAGIPFRIIGSWLLHPLLPAYLPVGLSATHPRPCNRSFPSLSLAHPRYEQSDAPATSISELGLEAIIGSLTILDPDRLVLRKMALPLTTIDNATLDAAAR